MGATHAVDPGVGDPAEQIRAIVPGGVDHAFEAIGIPAVADQAFRSVRDGGTTVLIGQPAMGVKAGFDVYDVTQFEHTILGTTWAGQTRRCTFPGWLGWPRPSGSVWGRWSPTGCHSTRSTRRSRSPPPVQAEGS